MQDKYVLGAIAIGSIAVMETAALICGINGSLLSIAVGAISAIVGGIVGYGIKTTK